MVAHIVMSILIFVALIVVLKTGLFISVMSSVPFIGGVADIMAGYFEQPGPEFLISDPTGTIFEEVVNSLIFFILFYYISRFCVLMFQIGRHEEASWLRRIIAKPMTILSGYVFSAWLTAMLADALDTYVMERLSDIHPVLEAIAAVSALGAFGVIVYFMLKLTIKNLLLFWGVKIVFVSVVRLLAVEFVVVFSYYLLRVPGIFDSVGTLGIMAIGILSSFGALIGTEFVDKKVEHEIGAD